MTISPDGRVEASVPNFLGSQRQELLDFVLGQEQSFRAATVAQGDARAVNEAVRRARILDSLGAFEGAFVDHLKEQLPWALDRLGHPEFPFGRIEVQATASNHGDYFRLHQDGGPDATREISFVYFLHDEPRRFSGGELRICRTRWIDGRLTPRDLILPPQGETLVFFPSRQAHEVLPVDVPSQAFADSRFTVNGWIHRTKR
jgi:hypothetical protein